jgi:hypothetical protein
MSQNTFFLFLINEWASRVVAARALVVQIPTQTQEDPEFFSLPTILLSKFKTTVLCNLL